MRDYGKVQTTFWTSQDTSTMSDTGRMLALYLLTSPHSNILGCFHLPIGYVCEDLKWAPTRVEEGFAELFDKGFATHDKASKWVVMHAYLKWNPIENPNQGISAGRLFEQIPDKSTVKPALAAALREFAKHFPRSILDHFATVAQPLPKPFRNQEQEQEQEQQQEQEQEEANSAAGKLAPTKAKPNASGSRLPADWKPSQADVEYCKTQRPDLLPSLVATNFYDYWISKAGAGGRKTDWSATWRMWVRKESAATAGRPAGAVLDLDAARKASNDEAKRRLFGNKSEVIDG
jgi:hypothetical protein